MFFLSIGYMSLAVIIQISAAKNNHIPNVRILPSASLFPLSCFRVHAPGAAIISIPVSSSTVRINNILSYPRYPCFQNQRFFLLCQRQSLWQHSSLVNHESVSTRLRSISRRLTAPCLFRPMSMYASVHRHKAHYSITPDAFLLFSIITFNFRNGIARIKPINSEIRT